MIFFYILLFFYEIILTLNNSKKKVDRFVFSQKHVGGHIIHKQLSIDTIGNQENIHSLLKRSKDTNGTNPLIKKNLMPCKESIISIHKLNTNERIIILFDVIGMWYYQYKNGKYSRDKMETWIDLKFGSDLLEIVESGEQNLYGSYKKIFYRWSATTMSSNDTNVYCNIDEIYVSPFDDKVIAVRCDRKILASNDYGNSFKVVCIDCISTIYWSEDSDDGIFLQQKISNGLYKLFYASIKSRSPSIVVFQSIVKLQSTGDVLIAEVNFKSKVSYYVSSYSHNFKLAYFPSKLLISSVDFHYSTSGTLYAIVNAYSKMNLYSASIFSLKFVKIFKYSTSLFINPYFSTILLANQVKNGLESTFISFNAGSEWHPVRLPYIDHNGLPITCEASDLCSYFIKLNDKYLIYGESSPWIIYTEAYIKKKTGIFYYTVVSRDNGVTWKIISQSFSLKTVVNRGDILVECPTYGNSLKYSIDEGISWIPVTLANSDIKIISLLPSLNKEEVNSYVIGYSFSDNSWISLRLMFKQYVLDHSCELSEYYYWNPTEMDSGSHCYRGTLVTLPRRILNATCYTSSDISSLMEIKKCLCEPDDFECAWMFTREGVSCVPDPDAADDAIDICGPNNYYLEISPYRKITIDTCDSTDTTEFNPHNQRLCQNSELFRFVVVFTEGKIFAISLDSNNNLLKNNMSMIVDTNTKLVDVDVDPFHKCYYFSDMNGISKYCLTLDGSTRSIVYKSPLVEEIEYDSIGGNIFFIEKNKLKIISSSGKRRTLIDYGVQTFKIYPVISKIVYMTASNQLTICNMNGENSVILPVNTNYMKYSFNYQTNEIFYVNEGLLKSYHISTGTLKNYFKITAGRDLEVNGNVFLMGMESIEVYNFNGNLLNSIPFDSVDMVIVDASIFVNYQNVCERKCSAICLMISKNQHTCLCPENMKLVDNICKCNEGDYGSHVECTSMCSLLQFKCNENTCIDEKFVCDGKIDCPNGLDETNCRNTDYCINKFRCNDTECISLSLVCNGFKDCSAGQDEANCLPTCVPTEFPCANGNCIDISLKCNGHDDCGDNSDEIGCTECKHDEFKCTDGLCISSTFKCNGYKDCSDGSDEFHCIKPTVPVNVDPSCPFKCVDNGKCLNGHMICDNIADCSDFSDEINCGYKQNCIDGYPCDNTCVSKDMICDGFKDCSDQSDEINCPKTTPPVCLWPFSYNCTSGSSCLDINTKCDTFMNCLDKSDENECDSNDMVNFNAVASYNSIKVIIESYEPKKHYHMLYNKLGEQFINTFFFRKNSPQVIIEYLDSCTNYDITVVISKNHDSISKSFSRRKRFKTVTDDYVYSKPSDLKYLKKDNLLSWDSTIPKCRPQIHFLSCLKSSDNSLIVSVFTIENSYNLHIASKMKCSVASCPFKIFNLTCSAYVDIIINHSVENNHTVIIIISIVLVFALFISTIAIIKYKLLRRKLSRWFMTGNENIYPISFNNDLQTAEILTDDKIQLIT